MRIWTDFITSACITILMICLITSVAFVSAQTRTSTNYQLQSDSINVGGALGSSASYRLESTVGEVGTGLSNSAGYSLRAGYQQMQSVFLSLAGGADVALSPNLPGITGGEANGSTTFTVITDSPAGYQLLLESENDPAMQRGDGTPIANYAPVAGADFVFTVPAASAAFGFSPEGVDVVSAFLDNGGACGLGALDTAAACWAGVSTTATQIASGIDANHPNGATTSVHYRLGIANGAVVPEGVYVATTTITALPL